MTSRSALFLGRGIRPAALTLLASACMVATAAIRSPSSADGQGSELWMSAYDPVSKTSYALDLGVTMNDFFIAGQQDVGVQRFWIIDPTTDAAWSQLLSAAAVTDIKWAVFGADATGVSGPGGRRLFTTVQQGSESRLYNSSDTSGVLKNPGVLKITGGLSQMVDPINLTGTHNNPADATNQTAASIAINGSGFVDSTNPNYSGAYFGNKIDNIFSATDIALPPTNAIGQSSWFYYVTTSSTSALGVVTLDEFDNMGHDGYFGFAQETGTNRYLLSYTLQAYLSAREASVNITASNNFARLAGILSLSGVVGRGDSVLSLTEGFLRGLANPQRMTAAADTGSRVSALAIPAGQALALGGAGRVASVPDLSTSAVTVSAVPEPQTWALFAVGLCAVAGLGRRSRRASGQA